MKHRGAGVVFYHVREIGNLTAAEVVEAERRATYVLDWMREEGLDVTPRIAQAIARAEINLAAGGATERAEEAPHAP